MKKILFIGLISLLILTGCGKKEEKITRLYSYTEENVINGQIVNWQSVGENLRIKNTTTNYNEINHKMFLAFDVDEKYIVKDILVCAVLNKGLESEKLICLNDSYKESKKVIDSLGDKYSDVCVYGKRECNENELYFEIDEDYGITIANYKMAPSLEEKCILTFSDVPNSCGNK